MVEVLIPGKDFPTGPDGGVVNYKVGPPDEVEAIMRDAASGRLTASCKLLVKQEHRHLFGSDCIWLCPDAESIQELNTSLPAFTLTEILEKIPFPPAGEVGDGHINPPTGETGRLDNMELIIVSSIAELERAVQEARAAGVCGLDVETTGLDPLAARMRLVQVAVPTPDPPCRVYVADCFELGQQEVAHTLAELLADPEVTVVGHNLKFDLAFIRQAAGQRLPMRNLFDTMLASQLNFAGYYRLEKAEKATKNTLKEVYPHHDLASLVERHLGFKLDKTEQAGNWTGTLTPEQLHYAAKDAAILLPLWEIQSELLRRNDLERAAKLEFDCIPAVVEIELAGMPFNAGEARRLLEEKEAILKEKEAVLTTLAGEAGFVPRPKKSQGKKTKPSFNPASTQDVLNCLHLLGHDVADTRDETLQDLAQVGCSFATILLEYRATTKQVNFLKEWLNKQHPVDDRLHSSYRQLNHNSTGRFSCSDPNLQQVPSRGEDGKTFRRLFQAPPGRKLIKADLAGIELRIMAWLADDEVMIEAFRQEADLHRLTAAAVAGKPPEEVTKAERQAAKAINFGLVYGCGPGRLMQSAKYEYGVEMSEAEAVSARKTFFSTYPGITAWHNRQKNLRYHPEPHYFHLAGRGYFAMQLVSVRTASGRKRVWPDHGGKTTATVTRLFNTPDQGTGADILKGAMAKFYENLLEAGWGGEVQLVACVHDELVAESPDALAEEVAGKLVAALETAGAEFISPVPVAAEEVVADTWGG